MQKTNFRKAGVILAVMVLAGLVLVGAGAAHDDHDALTWTEWTSADSLPDTAGNYCLTGDVTLSSTWHPKDGTNLCLDGHTVTKTGSGSVIYIDAGVSFGLYDCGTASTVTGGNVVYENDGCGVFVEDNGIFTMNGGTVSGNTAPKYGGGVLLEHGALFTMNDGTISGCSPDAVYICD